MTMVSISNSKKWGQATHFEASMQNTNVPGAMLHYGCFFNIGNKVLKFRISMFLDYAVSLLWKINEWCTVTAAC